MAGKILTSILSSVKSLKYRPNGMQYNPEYPVRIVPIGELDDIKDISGIMVSIDGSSSQSLEQLDLPQLVEISGELKYKTHKESTELIPLKPESDMMESDPYSRWMAIINNSPLNVFFRNYYIVCGDHTFDITNGLRHMGQTFRNTDDNSRADLLAINQALKEGGPVVVQGYLSRAPKYDGKLHHIGALRLDGFSIHDAQIGNRAILFPDLGNSLFGHTINPSYRHRS